MQQPRRNTVLPIVLTVLVLLTALFFWLGAKLVYKHFAVPYFQDAAYNDLKAERYDSALEHTERLLELEPSDHTGHYNRGLALVHYKRYAEAAASFRKAAEIQPEADSYLSLGYALEELNKHQEAVDCYDQALKYNAKDIRIYINKGIAYKYLNKPKDAIACFDQALKLDPNDIAALEGKGTLLKNTEHYQEACECFARILDFPTEDYYPYESMGYCLSALGKHQQALSYLNKAISLKSDEASTYEYKAYALSQLGRHKEARALIDQAIALNRDAAQTVDFLMTQQDILFQQKDYLAVRKVCSKIIAIDNKHANAYYNRACAAALLKRPLAEILPDLQAAFKLDPKLAKWAATDPDLASLRQEPDFRRLTDRRPTAATS